MSSSRVRTLRDLALQARAHGSYMLAAEAYRELEQLEPDEPLWSKSLADCLDHLGEVEASTDALRRAGAKYAQRGFTVRAIAVHKVILRRDPGDRTAVDTLVALRARRESAIDRFRRTTPPSRPRDDLHAPMHDELEGSQAAVTIAPGVYDVRLEPAREAPGSPPSTFELDALAASPLFARLSPASLRRVVDAIRLVELAAEDVLYRRGEPATAMYMIVDGRIELTAEGTRGGRPLAELGPGDVVGVVGLCAAAPRPITAIARHATSVLEIPLEAIGPLLREAPELRHAMIDLARQRLLAVLLGTHPLFRRLASMTRYRIADRFRFFEIEEGACLVEVGRPPSYLHVVMTGRLEVRGVDGEVVAALGTGSLAAETEFLSRSPVVLPILARRRSFVLSLPYEEFIAVTREDPQFLHDVKAEATAPVWDPSLIS